MNIVLVIRDLKMSLSLKELLCLEKRVQSVDSCADVFLVHNIMSVKTIHLVLISTDFEFDTLRETVEYFMLHNIKVVLIGKKSSEIEFAIKWRVFDFVSLPLNDKHLKLILLIVQRILFESSTNIDRDIFFKVKNSKLVKVNLRDINYIEALANHISISYALADRLVVYSTMKGIENHLPSHYFMRVHNSFIIQLSKISGIDGNNVIINSKLIPVSRSNWKSLMEKLETI